MKNWKEYVFDVNGFQINTLYSEETIETIFLPMLRKFTGMQKKLGRRLIVFLAAPPAVGKTTLSKFLEYLAVQQEDLTEIPNNRSRLFSSASPSKGSRFQRKLELLPLL